MDKELLLMYLDMLAVQVYETQQPLADDNVDAVYLALKQIEGNAAKAAGNIDAAAVSPAAKEEATWFAL